MHTRMWGSGDYPRGSTPVGAIVHRIANHHVMRSMVHVGKAFHLVAQLSCTLLVVGKRATRGRAGGVAAATKKDPLQAKAGISLEALEDTFKVRLCCSLPSANALLLSFVNAHSESAEDDAVALLFRRGHFAGFL
jgi:hypothetical protein